MNCGTLTLRDTPNWTLFQGKSKYICASLKVYLLTFALPLFFRFSKIVTVGVDCEVRVWALEDGEIKESFSLEDTIYSVALDVCRGLLGGGVTLVS